MGTDRRQGALQTRHPCERWDPVHLAGEENIVSYYEHLKRYGQERGRDGSLIYAPTDELWDCPFEDFRKERIEKWGKPVSEMGWERVWLLMDDDSVVGRIKLGDNLFRKTVLHRASLGMGIEKAYRAQGRGYLLLKTAIDWAKKQPSLDWVQLFVLSQNEPAKRLYQKFSFVEIGTTPDMFRAHGVSISDTEMVLKLKE